MCFGFKYRPSPPPGIFLYYTLYWTIPLYTFNISQTPIPYTTPYYQPPRYQPPPPDILPPTIHPNFFAFLQLLQLLVHIHPDPPLPPDGPPPPNFFCIFTITSILGSHPPWSPRPTPPPKLFSFSQLLQSLVHIHPDPPPVPQIFFCIYTITSILGSHPPWPPNRTPTPWTDPGPFCTFIITLILVSHPSYPLPRPDPRLFGSPEPEAHRWAYRIPMVQRPSSVFVVRCPSTISTPLNPLGQSKPNFIWSLLRKGEQKFI